MKHHKAVLINPAVYNVSVGPTDTFEDTEIVFDNTAVFCQITNLTGSDSVEIRLNNLTEYFRLEAGYTQVFNHGDLTLSSIAFRNPGLSGGGSEIDLNIIAGVLS